MKTRITAIIPTYNNAATLAEVIERVARFLPDIIVVNDGSTDTTADILANRNDCTVIFFSENRGKGCALLAGFEKAEESGFTHAITIDSDGQHLPEDIPLLIKSIDINPETLWVGNRILPYTEGEKPPVRSIFGRKFGNFWYKFNTGIVLHDTQCGFRAYPLKEIRALPCQGKRYEYEQEALVKAAWNGIPVKEVPIRLYYLPADKVVSHFRPVRDFIRISKVNSKAAITRILLPVTALEVPGATWREKIIALAKHELRANTSPKKAASSVSLGVFMGIFPIHGFQVATLMGLTFLLRLNRPLAILGVCVSSPPFMPFLIVVAVATGRLVLPPDLIMLQGQKTAQILAQGALEFVVGSTILSIVAGIAAYFITFPMFQQLTKKRLFKKLESSS